MTNEELWLDYLIRAKNRIIATQTLYSLQSYADVVRESQEIVELALKGLLRQMRVNTPHTHDVSPILLQNKALLPEKLQAHAEKLAKISRQSRRDREMSYYGSEDLTPSKFYTEEDATEALSQATFVVETIWAVIGGVV